MRPRLIVTGLVGVLSIAIAFAAPTRVQRATDDPVSVGPDDWRSVVEPESLETVWEEIEGAIEIQRTSLDVEGPDTRGAAEDCLLLVRSWVEDQVSVVMDARIGAGMVFRRENALKQCETAVRWRFASPRPDDWYESATDTELFEEIAGAQRASGLLLEAVDVGAVRVGHRLGLTMPSETWPYRGTAGCHSLFEGPRGIRRDLREIDHTTESFFVNLRVRFMDGRPGLLQFNYAWDDQIEVWVPVKVNIGVDSGQYWPWPFAN